MDGRTDGWMDGQGDSYIPPKLCLRGGGFNEHKKALNYIDVSEIPELLSGG